MNRPSRATPDRQHARRRSSSTLRPLTDDASVRVVILTGAGTAFSAGGNVKDMRELFDGRRERIRDKYRHGIQRIAAALYNLEVPMIAAVNGPAIGAGLRPRLHVRHPHRLARARSSPRASSRSASCRATAAPGCCRAWSACRRRRDVLHRRCHRRGRGAGLRPRVAGRARRPNCCPRRRRWPRASPPIPAQALRLTKRLLREGQHTPPREPARAVGRLPGAGAQDGGPRRGGERLRREAEAGLLGRLTRGGRPDDRGASTRPLRSARGCGTLWGHGESSIDTRSHDLTAGAARDWSRIER